MAGAPVQFDIQAQLDAAERGIQAVSAALLQGQPEHLESAASELQQSALALSGALHALRGRPDAASQLRQRLGKVVQAIAMQREACVRRSCAVERSLHSIVPATRASTYAGALGPYKRNGPSGASIQHHCA